MLKIVSLFYASMFMLMRFIFMWLWLHVQGGGYI